MNNKIVIDGSFCLEQLTGIQRMALEIIHSIDLIDKSFDIELLVPIGMKRNFSKLNKIKVVEFGKYKSKRQWYCTYPLRYAKKNNRVLVNIAECFPFQKNGVSTVADVRLKENLFKESRIWKYIYDIKTRLALKYCNKIVTLSQYSKNRIISLYKVNPNKIYVVPCAWQHYTSIIPDESVFLKFPNIKRGNYFYTVGSLAPHKNYKWIYEVAKRNKSLFFVVTGGEREVWKNSKYSGIDNIFYTGYLNDSEMKALMLHSKAFIFPTLYEGFGIPPMEALSCGKKCIVSDIPVMHEIYENSVYYVNPNYYNYDLDMLLKDYVDEPSTVLNKYSWIKSGNIWLDILFAKR